MSDAKRGSVWGRWIPHPVELLGGPQPSGGVFAGVVLQLLGAPGLMVGLLLLLRVTRAPSMGEAVFPLLMGVVMMLVGGLLLQSGESSFGRAPPSGLRRSRPLVLLGVRAATASALLVGFGKVLAGRWAIGEAFFDSASLGWSGIDGVGLTSWALLPALLASVLVARGMLRVAARRLRPAVVGWAVVTAGLLLVSAVAWALAAAGLPSLPGAGAVWRGMLWTLAGSGLAVAMGLAAEQRLALWNHAERWREATLTPELRIVFADGSGARPASEYFTGYAGPVVVMPTAEAAGAVFRGDGAPADGWVVPGTRAALEESVRCARAMACLTVATVGLMAAAPMAFWLVSLVG